MYTEFLTLDIVLILFFYFSALIAGSTLVNLFYLIRTKYFVKRKRAKVNVEFIDGEMPFMASLYVEKNWVILRFFRLKEELKSTEIDDIKSQVEQWTKSHIIVPPYAH